jgi:hypothetical protein
MAAGGAGDEATLDEGGTNARCRKTSSSRNAVSTVSVIG